jgi:6-phosphogluconolactonase
MTSAGGTSGNGGTTPGNGGTSGAPAGGASGMGGAAGSGGNTPATTAEKLYVAGAVVNGNGSIITEYDVKLDTPVTVTKGPSLNVDGLASFLAFSPSGDRLYATDENGGMLRSFKLDATTGAPTVLNAVMTAGHPTHVAVDSGAHFVFGADYNEGKVEVVGLDQSGALTSGVDSETPGSQTHEVVLSPDAKFAFVPCKGSDKVAQFEFNGATGALDANTPPSVASAGGAGPRHLAFGPGAKFAYVIDELGNTMETMAYDSGAGVFTRKGALTTLPSGFTGSSTAAEVAVSPSGRFLYGSNRIVNDNGDLVIYAIAQDGTLSLVGHESTRGVQPRHFSLDPSGKLLFVANLDSKTLVVFSIDDATGKLTFVTQMDAGMQPYYAGVNPVH